MQNFDRHSLSRQLAIASRKAAESKVVAEVARSEAAEAQKRVVALTRAAARAEESARADRLAADRAALVLEVYEEVVAQLESANVAAGTPKGKARFKPPEGQTVAQLMIGAFGPEQRLALQQLVERLRAKGVGNPKTVSGIASRLVKDGHLKKEGRSYYALASKGEGLGDSAVSTSTSGAFDVQPAP